MGCAQSKIDNEESVSRCKDRRNFMKEAVSSRNAFASGHSGYGIALKNTGAALSDYGQGEAEIDHHHHHHQLTDGGGGSLPAPPPPPLPPSIMDQTLPPPPPLPNFSPATPPLQRSVTMPEFPVSQPIRKMKSLAIEEEGDEGMEEDDGSLRRQKNRRNVGPETPLSPPLPPPSPPRTPLPPPPPESKGLAWDYFFMVENMPGPSLSEPEDQEQEHEGKMFEQIQRYNEIRNVGNVNMGEIEPKTPEKVAVEGMEREEEETPVVVKEKQFMHSNTAPPIIRGGNNDKVGSSSVNLLKILNDIDDHFLKASESAQEVSKMLEATRLHYHSNFADNRGHIDHAARVMRVITWNRSFRGVPNGDGGKDDVDAEDYETHATVLDKLLAWEKKLFDEVKTGELMKLEYQRKVALLNRLKKRGASSESLEKAKAAVSHLHTRYIVDMQSLDSTVSEVNQIRDDQLYPKLVSLVDGMAKMWESMCIHHDNQLKIVLELKSLDVSGAPKETSKHHHERTIQLWNVVLGWHSQFEKLVAHQKQYIKSLNGWLKLNLIPIESSFKEKISSPPRIQNPPIQLLLHSWHDHLEKLPDELAKSAISSFAAVLKTIVDNQEEEMKLKEKCEETRKEFFRKKQAYEEWHEKYRRRTTTGDIDGSERGDETNTKNPVSEKEIVVEIVKKRLEEELENHQKHCVQVRDKSLGSLKIRLPELFRAMSDYSHTCSESYERLRSITQSQNGNGGSS